MYTPKKTFFLLDAYALIFRAYYAFIKNPQINSKGIETSAIMGFMNSLLEIIKKEKPEFLAVAFDKGGSNDRVEIFEAYKANRNETPDAIKIAVPYIQNILKAMHIPILEVAGYEADDIIGTVAKQAEKQDFKIFMVTPDKDFAQLVSPNIFLYKPARMGNGIEIWGEEEVKARFEIEHPLQVIDYLGMMGDSVDNIPGLPGVGDKTAKKFIKAYGSMEKLLENTNDLKGKLKEKIEQNKDIGILSKKLATIMLDIPVKWNKNDIKISEPDIKKVDSIFQELEFNRVAQNFKKAYNVFFDVNITEKNSKIKSEKQLGLFDVLDSDNSENSNSSQKNIETIPHFYQLINSKETLTNFVNIALKKFEITFDIETTSLDTKEANLIGISFSWEAHKGYYVPFNIENTSDFLNILKPLFESKDILKIGHNLKYNIQVIKNHGIEIKGQIFDTMIAHYLINPDMRHNINILSETYLNYTPVSIESLIEKKGSKQKSIKDIPLDLQLKYAVEDADITYQLKLIFKKQLEEKNVLKLFNDIEMPLINVLSNMELEGINLDITFLKKLSDEFQEDIVGIEKDIYQKAGEEFNIDSPKQLGNILFDKLKLIDKPKKTKTGQYATSEDVLLYLAKDHKIISNVLNYRQLKKLKSTYVDALPEKVSKKTNRVHTDYSQAVAATGRLSSNNPNLQNIPIRTERGRLIRKAFIPRDENYQLLAADYSQIELRIIAALSGDDSMIQSFVNDEDIHLATAAKVFKIPLDKVSREQRSHAKTVNFGIIYGVSAFGLSNQTDLSRSESKELIDVYYENYPKLRTYIDNQISFAKEKGYVETILGRRRYLPNINSANHMVRGGAERNAVNAPIQGSAADIIKIGMINIQKILEKDKWKSKILLQVHDELIFDAHNNEMENLKKMVKYEMENAYKLNVPLKIDIGIGENWLVAH